MVTDETPDSNLPAEPKRKRKIGFAHKMALLAVIERLQFTDRPDYKAISMRTGVSVHYLRHLVHEWRRDRIDLGTPETKEEEQVNARMQHEKTLLLTQRFQALLLTDFEAALLFAEDLKTRKGKTKVRAWEEAGLPQIVGELKRVMDLRERVEKGYNTVLEEISQRNQPKVVGPQTEQVATKIVGANAEARALSVLG